MSRIKGNMRRYENAVSPKNINKEIQIIQDEPNRNPAVASSTSKMKSHYKVLTTDEN